MKLSYLPYYLQFRHPFGVSSNTRTETLCVFVKLESAGQTGYGEACLPAYLGETQENTILFFETARTILNRFSKPFNVDLILRETGKISSVNNAAKAAIDMALNDLAGKIGGKPYYKMTGIGKSTPTATSHTIGIDIPEKLEQKIKEAADFQLLKIKTGTSDDKQLIKQIRKYTDKPLYIDVNQGWTDKIHALEMICWLKDQNVVLVEQPMPKEMKVEMTWLTKKSPLPLIADESVKRLSDLEQLDESFSGINIKLMKCAGMAEAVKMINHCRKKGLKVMLGCMAESSCGTSAMAQLMGLADYVDLDAPLLYYNDPFTGVSYEKGKVCLNDLPGIGVKIIDPDFPWPG